jgi:HEAT repeat protein
MSDELENLLAVSVREANDIMFALYDEVFDLEAKVEALERQLWEARGWVDAKSDAIKAKRDELRQVGYAFDLRNGVYKRGERPRHEGMVGSVRDQEWY